MTVLAFDTAAKCPVGGRAIHPEHGWCEIVAVDGFTRTVGYEMYDANEVANYAEAEVDVRDLREVNPEKDMRPRKDNVVISNASWRILLLPKTSI